MMCCVAGALVTATVLWVSGLIRYRLLGMRRPEDPTAWHLELPDDETA